MSEDVREIFVVVVEGKLEGPIVMEASAGSTSREQAEDRLRSLLSSPNWFRGCVAKVEYEFGNEALLNSMKELQK